MKPGEIILKKENDFLILNEGSKVTKLIVKNSDKRNIQVGSHFHFYEVNEALVFEREKAKGKRLNIPAGTTFLFKGFEEIEVELIEFRGKRRIVGFKGRNF